MQPKTAIKDEQAEAIDKVYANLDKLANLTETNRRIVLSILDDLQDWLESMKETLDGN